MEILEYIERPKLVKAVRWDGADFDTLKKFCGEQCCDIAGDGTVRLLYGPMCGFEAFDYVEVGDYIVDCGERGFIPMTAEDFDRWYVESRCGY